MKSKLNITLLLALFIAFTSCKKEEEAAVPETTTSQEPIIVPAVTPAIRTENYAPAPQQPSAPSAQNMPQVVNQTVAPVATKAGMNPPHGQPGHRCDIQVGAPLNSPVAKAPKAAATPGQASFTPSTTSVPVPMPTSATPSAQTPALLNAPVVTAPGMNPPHGQEGHRCDIAVGQPLPK